jgi:Carboxypeptidase regulatory-like domain
MRCLFAVLLCSAACGQDTGSIHGMVVDPTGSPFLGAAVALGVAGQTLRTDTKTDAKGAFRFERLPAGSYDLSASAPGFRKIHKEIEVRSGEIVPVPPLTLQLGSVGCSSPVATPSIAELPTPGRPRVVGTLRSGRGGRAVRAATVVLTDIHNTHKKVKVKTDSQGRYEFLRVQPGSYHLAASKRGYTTFLVDWNVVRVLPGQVTVIGALPMWECDDNRSRNCGLARSVSLTICE